MQQPNPRNSITSRSSSESVPQVQGGRYDFEDGGSYIGCWDEGRAHGYGVCSGPRAQGEYAGSWHQGFEVCGVYRWPNGAAYAGQWDGGKRHGLGVESRGQWLYRGEWTHGLKGRYGVRQSTKNKSCYEGTWTNGLQDGSGIETYADGGSYAGNWCNGMRQGLGVRTSVPFGKAALCSGSQMRTSSNGSLEEDPDLNNLSQPRCGFVLNERCDPIINDTNSSHSTLKGKLSASRSSLLSGLRIKMKKNKRDGSVNSLGSNASSTMSSVGSACTLTTTNGIENLEATADVTEIYMGEWKEDKRCGLGVCQRSDGLLYEGVWHNNKRDGPGCLTLPGGETFRGKWRHNALITTQKRKSFLPGKHRNEKVEKAIADARHNAELARRKTELVMSRANLARLKSEQADQNADIAQQDAAYARIRAKEFTNPPRYQQSEGGELGRNSSNSSRGSDGSRRFSLHALKNFSFSSHHGKPHSLKEEPEENGSLTHSKDYLAVPSKSHRSSSDQDVHTESGSKSDFGSKVKNRLSRLSRSFRSSRKGKPQGSANVSRRNSMEDKERHRSSSLDCSKSTERLHREKLWDGPSWEIPPSFLPTPTPNNPLDNNDFTNYFLFPQTPNSPENRLGSTNSAKINNDSNFQSSTDKMLSTVNKDFLASGEMVVFVLIINLGLTALFAHLFT